MSRNLLGLDLSDTQHAGDYVLRGLAVVGAAALGFLVTGWVVQLLVKAWFGKSMPRPALMLVRSLGGLTLGVLVGLWLFGAGGPGVGGWGWGLGGGGGFGIGGQGTTAPQSTHTSDTRPARDGGDTARSPDDTLQVEVLGDERVRDGKLCRFKGGQELLTLEEMVRRIEQRHRERASLKRVEIVLYENSPDRETGVVKDLADGVKGLGLTPVVVPQNGKAP
jgi:hypothetical protein